MLIDNDRNVLETAQTGIPLAFAAPPSELLDNVNESEPEIAVLPEENYVAAVIRLRAFKDTFLYVARQLDPHVVAQLKQTEASVAEYAEIEIAATRHPGEFRADIRGHRADHFDGLYSDRVEFRQLAGRSDTGG